MSKEQNTERVHETNLTFIIFGALSYQLSMLDGMYEKQAKKWFTTLFAAAKNLWFTLYSAMEIEEHYEEGKGFYSNKSAFLYDSFRILVDIPEEKHNEILKILNKELNK